jgi:hypothetical protein
VSEGENIEDESSVPGYGYALSPWSGGREDENERRSSSSKRGSRTTRIGGYWAPTSFGSSSSSSARSPAPRPSTNGGARGPSAPEPSGGGDGNPGNGKPGGNDGGGDRPPTPKPDPSTPPPPTQNPGNDDPPPPDDRPPEEPPPHEPEPPPADVDPCLYEQESCISGADEACVYDPDYCEQYQLECGYLYEACAYPSCEQTYSDCLVQLDTVCLQDAAFEDPELQELCIQLYDQCSTDYNVCLGYGDDEAEPGQGVEFDEYP